MFVLKQVQSKFYFKPDESYLQLELFFTWEAH